MQVAAASEGMTTVDYVILIPDFSIQSEKYFQVQALFTFQPFKFRQRFGRLVWKQGYKNDTVRFGRRWFDFNPIQGLQLAYRGFTRLFQLCMSCYEGTPAELTSLFDYIKYSGEKRFNITYDEGQEVRSFSCISS